ncbi:MAG: AI-2E family transporter [Parachlamydiaceae bacterium]|nr:AI-2E family transporter [Parachlamydiaceae bacterium]
MWIEQNFFKYIIGVILVLISTLLFYHNLPVFYELITYIAAICLPLLISTIFYYVLRPIIRLLENWIPRYLAILLVYLVIGIAVYVLVVYFLLEIVDLNSYFSVERTELLKEKISQYLTGIENYFHFSKMPLFENLISKSLPVASNFAYNFFLGFMTIVADAAIAIALTPFVLYYFLRDDKLFARFILRFVPLEHQEQVQKILTDIDTTLGGFIFTQATTSMILGTSLFFGYLFLGLPYPFLLAIFATIFYIIPFLGTFIAIIPALLVAMTIDGYMILNVIGLMAIAHFVESYVIAPKLMSNNLKIHPLTVIFLLLIASYLFKVLGLILVIPAYAIIKVIVWNIYKILRLKYKMAQLNELLEAANSEAEQERFSS